MLMRPDFGRNTRINTATTTQVKVGNAILKSITVGTPVATETITIIDGDGTTNVTRLVVTLAAGQAFTLKFDTRFTNGIRITSSGTTDFLVTWA